MTRYYPRFAKGGFPELYAVCDSLDNAIVGDPKPYHEANDEAGARNAGTWGQPETNIDWGRLAGFCAGTNFPNP